VFSIALPTYATAFDLVVRPTADRQAMGPVPTFRVRPEGLLPDAEGHVRVLLPATLPAVHWAGTVEYPEARGMRAVPSAVIQMHADDVADATTGVVGTLDLTLRADANGLYDGYVLPGNYTVTITSPATDELGVLHELRDLHPSTTSNEILGHIFH